MGNPAFYYYPDRYSSLERLDLGEGLSDIEEIPGVLVEDAVAMDGTPYRSVLGPAHRVTLTLSRFGSPGANALERDLQALLSYLRRGGVCGFSRDVAKTFAAHASGAWARGATSLPTYGNQFAAWRSDGAVAADDEVAVETAPPTSLYEVRLCDAMVGNQVHFDAATTDTLVYSHGDGKARSCWVRYRDFWPCLFLAANDVNKVLLSHDARRNYTLELPLVYLPGMMAELLASVGLDLGRADTTLGGRLGSAGSFGGIGSGSTRAKGLRGTTAPATGADSGYSLQDITGSGRGSTFLGGGLR